MYRSQLYGFLMVVYMIIVILLLRFVLPLLLEVDTPFLRGISIEVARVFIAIVAIVILMTLLVTFAFCAFHFGNTNSFAVLIPLHLVIIFVTYAGFIKSLVPQLGHDAILVFLTNTMNNQFKKNKDDSMSKLQSELKCCGIWGPSEYLVYMEKVPPSCYEDMSHLDPSKLLLRGCVQTLDSLLGPAKYLALTLGWGAILLEFVCLVFSVREFAKRFIKRHYRGCLQKI